MGMGMVGVGGMWGGRGIRVEGVDDESRGL